MAHLIIKNVGPIKNVEIELNKVNIIMGPQSSGKSTINKIACYCTWVEKRVSLDQSFEFFWKDNGFYNELVRFHKLEGYFNENSEIEFESPIVKFSYKQNSDHTHFEWVDKFGYERTKISYIPAERNIVSIINEWKEVSLPDNNIRSFMNDWNVARKIYTSKDHACISYLNNVEYYYDSNEDADYVQNSDGSKIQLMNASSGLQSLVPLYVLVKYFTEWIYNNRESKSVSSKEKTAKLLDIIINRIEGEYKEKGFDHIFRNLERNKISPETSEVLGKATSYLAQFIKINGTNLFIEEPELNLFPTTQRDLLYNLMKFVKKYDKNQLFITTHSPYILYALNNCMMGYLVKGKMPEAEANEVLCRNAWINPELVSVWEIKDGELRTTSENRNNTIQGEDGLISDNYFDENMKEVMDDFYKMLNYYGDDKDKD